MRKRTRLIGTLRPGTSELERHQGVSTLLLGGAAAALAPFDQPSFVEVDRAPAIQANDPAQVQVIDGTHKANIYRNNNINENYRVAAGSAGIEVVSQSSARDQCAQPAALENADKSSIIRPLSLAPNEAPETITQPRTLPPPQPLNKFSSAVGAAADSSVPPVTVTPPTIIPLPTPVPSVPQGSPSGLLGIVLPGGGNPGLPAAPNNIFSAMNNSSHGHHLTSQGHQITSTGGISIGHGLSATGGGSHQLRGSSDLRAGLYVADSSGGGAGTGLTGHPSGTSSGSNSDAASSVASQGKNSASGGTFSFTSMQGMERIQNQGHVSISTMGASPNLIGGSVAFTAMAAAPGAGSWTVQSATWTCSGSTPLYASQSPAAVADGKFINNNYNISGQSGSTIGFYWGEKPGVNTVTVTATVHNAALNKTITAKKTSTEVTVKEPTWSGKVVFLKSASVKTLGTNIDWLTYGSSQPGQDPGITWAGIAISPGTYTVVQLVTGGTLSISNPGATPPWTQSALTGAPFPLVDVPKSYTAPFYPQSGIDSPNVPLQGGATKGTLNLTFKDYVMYQPPSGIFVPQGIFSWTVNATATYSLGIISDWTVTNVAAPAITPNPIPPNHSSWPQWNAPSYNYTELK